MAWLKDYTIGLAVGVIVLVSLGIIMQDPGITANVVYDQDQYIPTGQVKEIMLISKDCTLTPTRMVVNQGDFVVMSATVYDDNPHRIHIEGYNIDIKVPGNKVATVEFYARQKGKFRISDVLPCEYRGYDNEAFLIVN